MKTFAPMSFTNCSASMARLPLARKPLVIVDRCPSHGHWCDGGEFGQLKTVARTRGVAEALGGSGATGRAKVPPLAEDDPILAELKKRPGNWGLVPPEVSRMDALSDIGSPRAWGRRRRGYRGLLDVLFQILVTVR